MLKSVHICLVLMCSTTVYASVLPPPRPSDLNGLISEAQTAELEQNAPETRSHPLPPKRLPMSKETEALDEAVDLGPDTSRDQHTAERLIHDHIQANQPDLLRLDALELQINMIQIERSAFWSNFENTAPDNATTQERTSECSFICVRRDSLLGSIIY